MNVPRITLDLDPDELARRPGYEPLRPGIDILFSPGMPVTWSQIDVGEAPAAADDTPVDAPDEFTL